MDREDAVKRVKKIKNLCENEKDYEAAHSVEDDLYLDFIRDIASGENSNIHRAQAIAKTILEIEKFEFSRWG